MSYDDALRAAGAEVHAYQTFGSYQGDWLAKVTFDGETFWIRDYFGSCTVCDAFEAEVGYAPYDDDSDVEKAAYAAKVKAFGTRYLEPSERLTEEEALAKASENAWDDASDEMVAFIKANSANPHPTALAKREG